MGIPGTGILSYTVSDNNDPGGDSVTLIFFATTDTTLAIATVERVETIAVYPNPTVDKLYLKLNNQKTVTPIIVYNAEGKIVISDVILSSTPQLDVEGLPKGTYYLQLRPTDGAVKVAKFVKN